MTMTTTTIETGALCHVDPGSLLIERNIRESQPSKAMIASVKAVGVLEPITAYTNPEGGLVVRYGHRRVLAALAAGLDTVPVYVAGEDWRDDDAEVDRIIRQRDENTHREGLTSKDEAGVVAQLAAFGLSAAEISKKARMDRETVEAAQSVLGSEIAKKAVARYEDLTLDQAAAVAEFEDDPETAKGLILTAIERPVQFAHVAQRARDDREHARLVAEATARFTSEGVTVLDTAPSYNDRPKALHYLADAETGEPITEANHADCPGRACTVTVGSVYVDADGNVLDEHAAEEHRDNLYQAALDEARAAATEAGEDPDDVDDEQIWVRIGENDGLTETKRGVPYWYCTDPAKHGHKDRYSYGGGGSPKKPADQMTDKEREAARKARALVIENNKAWDSAQTVRRTWLANLAKRKSAPKGTAEFIATALACDRNALTDYRVTQVVADIVGSKGAGHLDTHILRQLKGASDGRAQVLALVQILGALEATLTQQSWRGNGTNSTAGRYLRFLESCDYPLSDVEKFAISSKTA